MHLYPIRMQLQSEERSINHAGRTPAEDRPCLHTRWEWIPGNGVLWPSCVYSCTQAETHTPSHTLTYIHRHTHSHIHTDTHIHKHTHRLTDTYSQTHIHTFTPTLTHKHTVTHIFFSKLSLKSYIIKILEIFYTSWPQTVNKYLYGLSLKIKKSSKQLRAMTTYCFRHRKIKHFIKPSFKKGPKQTNFYHSGRKKTWWMAALAIFCPPRQVFHIRLKRSILESIASAILFLVVLRKDQHMRMS